MSERLRLFQSVLFTSSFLFLLWIVKITEYVFFIDLSSLGLYPRTLRGSLGIITSPLIHDDFYHLISNSFPIAILGISLWYFYREVAYKVIIIIYFLSGFWVWIAARPAFHIGASGIVYGLMFFLLFMGILRMERKTLSISLIVILLYGSSIISGLIPMSEGVSYETHITGAIAGLFSAFLYRKNDYILFDNQRGMENEMQGNQQTIEEVYHSSHTADSETIITVNYKYSKPEKEK